MVSFTLYFLPSIFFIYFFLREIFCAIHLFFMTKFRLDIFNFPLINVLLITGKHGNKIQLDSGTRLFLYQLVGTWGQLLFPKPWKEFRLWYDEHKAKGIKPLLDGMVPFFSFFASLSFVSCVNLLR